MTFGKPFDMFYQIYNLKYVQIIEKYFETSN